MKCSANAPKRKWEKSIEKAKERNWVFYSDSSKNKEGRVGYGWMSHERKFEVKKGLGKLATVQNEEIKEVTKALEDWDKSRKVIVLTDSQAVIALLKISRKNKKSQVRGVKEGDEEYR